MDPKDPGDEQPEDGSEEQFMCTSEFRLYPSEVPSAAVEDALNPLFSGLREENSKLIPGVGAVPDPSNMAGGGVVGSYPGEYECFLKHKLEMACAAVAMTRVWPKLNQIHHKLGL